MLEEVLMTQAGLEEKREYLKYLTTVRRDEVKEALKEARSYGDLSENAEYDAAKEDQAKLEAEIEQLEDMLKRARVITEEEMAGDRVNLGMVVTLEDADSGKVRRVEIVGTDGADPFAEPAKITKSSPLGNALFDKQLGSDVVVNYTLKDNSVRTVTYRITGIDRAE